MNSVSDLFHSKPKPAGTAAAEVLRRAAPLVASGMPKGEAHARVFSQDESLRQRYLTEATGRPAPTPAAPVKSTGAVEEVEKRVAHLMSLGVDRPRAMRDVLAADDALRERFRVEKIAAAAR